MNQVNVKFCKTGSASIANKENKYDSDDDSDEDNNIINISDRQSMHQIQTNSTRDYICNISKRLATMILSVSRHSTVHSLSHLAQARNNKQQMLWVLIGMCAFIGFVINLYSLIVKYIEYPVLTNIYHDHQSFIYPDVTICNTNPIYFGSQKLNSTINNILLDFEKRLIKLKEEHVRQPHHSHSSLDAKASDLLFIQKDFDYSHPSWSLIIQCVYMQATCNWSHFEVRHIWPFGNCFTFNVTKMKSRSRNVKKSMIRNAWRPDFKIIIYKGLGYLHSFGRDPFNNINTPTGVMVILHEMDTYPYHDDGIFVDSYTQIDLKITTKVHLNVHNKCDLYHASYNYYDFKKDTCLTFVGRQTDCLVDIIQEEMMDTCQCVFHTIPVPCKFRLAQFCIAKQLPISMSSCVQQVLNKLNKHHKHKDCHRDFCSHTTFRTIVSHSSYPSIRERQNHRLWLKKLEDLQQRELRYTGTSDLHIHALNSDIVARYNLTSISQAVNLTKKIAAYKILDESFINRNFMQIRVVPSSLFMDHVEETLEYPLSRLLSDIGGCIGLWVGASLITFFELFDLFLRGMDIFFQYRNVPQRPDKWRGPIRNMTIPSNNINSNNSNNNNNISSTSAAGTSTITAASKTTASDMIFPPASINSHNRCGNHVYFDFQGDDGIDFCELINELNSED